jgi:hypothetical protein
VVLLKVFQFGLAQMLFRKIALMERIQSLPHAVVQVDFVCLALQQVRNLVFHSRVSQLSDLNVVIHSTRICPLADHLAVPPPLSPQVLSQLPMPQTQVVQFVFLLRAVDLLGLSQAEALFPRVQALATI